MDALTSPAKRLRVAMTVRTRAKHLSLRMKSRYGLTAEIVVVGAGSLPRSEGKAKRVFDHRK